MNRVSLRQSGKPFLNHLNHLVDFSAQKLPVHGAPVKEECRDLWRAEL